MPTWAEIQDYARSKYKLSRDDDNSFALVWGYEDGRSQQIFVHRFEAFDQEFIEFRTPVCKEDEMKATVALRKNAKFVVGALALEDEMIFLLHNAPLATMDIDEFEMPLHVLAGTADKLEAEYAESDDAY